MLFFISALSLLAFSAAAVLLIGDLYAERPRTRAVGRFAQELGTALSVFAVILLMVQSGWTAPLQRAGAFAPVAAIVGIGAIGLRVSFTRSVFGAVTAPICALLMLVHLIELQRPVTEQQEHGILLASHVGLALVGLGLFGLAAAIGLLYLVQERQLKARRFGRLFQRLPSLEELDAAGIRLVGLGFAIYSLSLGLGGYWAHRSGEDVLDARMLFAVFAWCVFAAVLHLRITSGWRGRQSALMTLVGFASALGVLFIYVGQ